MQLPQDTSIISTYVAYLQGRVLGGLLLHHLSEQVYTHSSDFFIMGGAQHQHWHQHQHSMSDGVQIRWKALDLFVIPLKVWRIVFDVYTKLSGGLKPIVRDSDTPRGRRPIFQDWFLSFSRSAFSASLPQYIQTSRLSNYHNAISSNRAVNFFTPWCSGVRDAKTLFSPTISFSSLIHCLPATPPERQPPPTPNMYLLLATSRMPFELYSTFQRLYGRHEFG